MKKRLISLLLAFIMAVTCTTSAFAASVDTVINAETCEEDITIDADTATTLGLLFVLSMMEGDSGDTATWSRSTELDQVIPMYDSENNVSAYAVTLKKNGETEGYVIVSTDLHSSLISEYSWGHAFSPTETNSTENSGCNTVSSTAETSEAIYYYGPMSYSYGYDATEELIVSEEAEESSADIYDTNRAMISEIQSSGLVQVNKTEEYAVSATYITDVWTWLEEHHSTKTFYCTGYGNLGEDSVLDYEIADEDYNACEVYAATNLIVYQFKRNGTSYTYKDVVARMKQIAIEAGFAEWDASLGGINYYIDLDECGPLLQYGLDYYGLKLTAACHWWEFLTSWKKGKSEIGTGWNTTGRPFVLHITKASGYSDHAVTAYAWTTVADSSGSVSYKFFKVKDGFGHSGTYVNISSGALTCITYAN